MPTIPITLKKNFILTNFNIFYKGLHHLFLAKMAKIKNCQVLMSRLEIKLRAQRGMTILILTFVCIMPAKTLNF